MGITVDDSLKSFNQAWNFISKEYQVLFIDILKIELLIFLIFGLTIAAIGVLFVLFFGSVLATEMAGLPSAIMTTSGIIFVLLSIFVLMIYSILSSAFTLSMYKIVAGRIEDPNVPRSVLSTFQSFLSSGFRYYFVLLGISVLFFVIPLSLFVYSFIAQAGILMYAISFTMLMIFAIAYLVFSFFLQFWAYEIAIAGKGVMDALNASIKLIRANLATVFGFWFALGILCFAISMTGSIIAQFVSMFLNLLIVLNPLLGIFLLLILFAISLLIGIIELMAVIPSRYFFWKMLTTGKVPIIATTPTSAPKTDEEAPKKTEEQKKSLSSVPVIWASSPAASVPPTPLVVSASKTTTSTTTTSASTGPAISVSSAPQPALFSASVSPGSVPLSKPKRVAPKKKKIDENPLAQGVEGTS